MEFCDCPRAGSVAGDCLTPASPPKHFPTPTPSVKMPL